MQAVYCNSCIQPIGVHPLLLNRGSIQPNASCVDPPIFSTGSENSTGKGLRNQYLMPIPTSTESDSNSTDSWFPSIQFFCPSLLYICLTNQYFELDKIFVIVSFIMQLELFQALLVHLCILRFYYRSVSNFPSSFYIGHKLKLSIWPKFILLLLLQNWTIHLDWSPRPLWLLHSTSLGAALENFEKHKFHWNTFSVNWML